MTSAARFAGLLTDEDRVKTFSAIALGARTVDAVVESTGLELGAAQVAVQRLVGGGLVEQRGGLHVATAALRAAARERAPRSRDLPGATPEQAKVLRNFVDEGRLKSLPARAATRRVILAYLVEQFEHDRAYDEREVNGILLRFHDDHAAVRRYLVDEGFLVRDGGVYHRAPA